MALPNFIEIDPQIILDECYATFSSKLGRPVNPNQLEGLLTQFVAQREVEARIAANNLARQMLMRYATGSLVDALAENLDVYRLSATNATAVFRFNLNSGHGGVTIPAGTMVTSQDGLAVFNTVSDVYVPYNQDFVDITLESMATGEQMNNYAVGYINVIQSPQPYLVSASNITVSSGGAAQETDEALKIRYKYRLSTSSTAGAKMAYRYYALAAHPAIKAVGVVSTVNTPGQVYIYPLLATGEPTPQSILDIVAAALNDEWIRPTGIQVFVRSPDRVNIDLVVTLVLYNDALASRVEAEVESNIRNYFSQLMENLGRDVVASQLIRVAQVDGVYSVDLNTFTTVPIGETQFPYLNSLTIQILGYTDG